MLCGEKLRSTSTATEEMNADFDLRIEGFRMPGVDHEHLENWEEPWDRLRAGTAAAATVRMLSGACGRQFGSFWGAVLEHLGASFGLLGALLGASWGFLEASWGFLGAFWGGKLEF